MIMWAPIVTEGRLDETEMSGIELWSKLVKGETFGDSGRLVIF